VIRLAPPLVITEAEMDEGLALLSQAIVDVTP
jgi:4-aminobutyrate aminotransferase-like enzyme